MSPGARLSVITVTFNSRDAVVSTLSGLLSQLREDDEVVVVDNASADGSADAVEALDERIRVIRNQHNSGFAAASNQGAASADGDVFVLLNPDAVPAPGFRDAIVSPLDRGWAAWMALVTMDDGRLINTSGGVLHFTGIAWAGQMAKPAAAAPKVPGEVGFASGACLAVPARRWREAGGFAEDYFMYHEDVELSLRLRTRGGVVGVEPAARVDHQYEFAKGSYKWRRLERNRWATILRTYPAALLLLLAPALLACELAVTATAVRGGWGREKLLAWVDLLRDLPRVLRARRAIQSQRAISAGEFARCMTPDLSSPFLGGVAQSSLVRVGLGAYWAAVLRILR